MGASWWVLIPLAAIVMGSIQDMMKLKIGQRKLGASTDELEREVDELRKRNSALTDRLENLEAIVVSQTWDAVTAAHASVAERELRVAAAAHREMAAPDPSQVNQQRVQQLANRLGR